MEFMRFCYADFLRSMEAGQTRPVPAAAKMSVLKSRAAQMKSHGEGEWHVFTNKFGDYQITRAL